MNPISKQQLDTVVLSAFLLDVDKFWQQASITPGFFQILHDHTGILALSARTDSNAETDRLLKLCRVAHQLAGAESETSDLHSKEATYLTSLLSQVSPPSSSHSWKLPPVELTLEKTALFPITHPNEQQELQAAYRTIGEALALEIEKLPKTQTPNPRQLVYHLKTLFERFLVHIPAFPHSDVSLFDHLRMTAAIAEGLYRYHDTHGDWEKLDDDNLSKWSLVCGDFSGIQSFIYRLTQKGAAKSLRGRSLYVQLFCDAAAQFIIRKLDLYPTALIYSSGGKFYLLIATDQQEPLRKIVNAINKWLLTEFLGDVFLGVGFADLTGEDLKHHRLNDKWKDANESLQQDRLKRFAFLLEAAEKEAKTFFEPQKTTTNSEHFCKTCGRDDEDVRLRKKEDEDTGETRHLCTQCNNLESLGKQLADAQYLLWVWGEDRNHLKGFGKPTLQFDGLDGLDCNLYVLKQYQKLETFANASLPNTLLERINNPDCLDGNPLGYRCGFRFIGKWNTQKTYLVTDPKTKKESQDWRFDAFTQEAKNIKQLGVLRMDVDNLGSVFIQGLKRPTLSRMATLSRQLNLFFAGYLNKLLEIFPRTQIIYSGGDDLFLIGSWDELPCVAWQIRQEFAEYCANNPHFTLSGGMVMVKATYPISIAAQEAGDAEKRAKELEYHEGQKSKDAFCFLETAIPWCRYKQVLTVRDLICNIVTRSDSHSIINGLRMVMLTMQEFERRHQQPNKSAGELKQLAQWHKWRWQLTYNLARMAERQSSLEGELTILKTILFENCVEGKSMLLPSIMNWLPLPVRWAEFLMRKEKM
jgi:CRISPR-associated protein Csm1